MSQHNSFLETLFQTVASRLGAKATRKVMCCWALHLSDIAAAMAAAVELTEYTTSVTSHSIRTEQTDRSLSSFKFEKGQVCRLRVMSTSEGMSSWMVASSDQLDQRAIPTLSVRSFECDN
jgi:hypothetical protein